MSAPDRTGRIVRWYTDRPESQQDHYGRVVRLDAVVSPGGRDPDFALVDDAGSSLPLYAPGLFDELRRCGDRTVRLTGKVVDLSDEGFGPELWVVEPPLPVD